MSSPSCHGNGAEHCCWVAGKPCPFLKVDVLEDRYWSCGLYNELGSWEKVHNDPQYLAVVRPRWDRKNIDDCGDWNLNQCCFAGAPEVHNTEEG